MIPAPAEYKVWAREASLQDVHDVAQKLRAADAREIRAMGFEPELGLEMSWRSSTQRYTMVTPEGVPIGMFGVGPAHHISELVGASTGCVWMVGSDEIKKVKVPFLRGCEQWLDLLHRDYGVLWNWADARNNLHLRWLEWLGFKIIGTAPIGVAGELFHQFIRVK